MHQHEALKDVVENNIKAFSDTVLMLKRDKQHLQNEIQDLETEIKNLKVYTENLEKTTVILNEVSALSRDNARVHFEKIVTNALQFASQSKDYEFVIKELTGRSKPSYEFYIKSTVNGIECLQKPEDANGGGFVDIVSVALKFAYLEIFKDPKISSNTLFYDEPGKMISSEMSIKFANYLKFLSSRYGKQTIMITHNDNLLNVADAVFEVNKDSNGVSKVKNATNNLLNLNSLIKDIDENI